MSTKTVGAAVGQPAPAFILPDQNGKMTGLDEILKKGPALIVFYPGDFTAVCTRQLCNYRDNLLEFHKFGIQIVGISANCPEEHARFAKEYDFSFSLLTDYDKSAAKVYGCTSLLMFGGISRAVFIINSKGTVLYRYVEPTVITRRKADELIQILSDLKKNKLI